MSTRPVTLSPLLSPPVTVAERGVDDEVTQIPGKFLRSPFMGDLLETRVTTRHPSPLDAPSLRPAPSSSVQTDHGTAPDRGAPDGPTTGRSLQQPLPLLTTAAGAEVVDTKAFGRMTREERRAHIAESIRQWAERQRAGRAGR